MGNQPTSLIRRLRYNDLTLNELELVSNPSELGIDGYLDSFCEALQQNRTVTSVVITNAFSDVVIGPAWRTFWEALVGIPNLEQVELLETGIPFYSLPMLFSATTTTLKYIGIHDGVLTGMHVKDIETLANSLAEAISLQEFVWEQDFQNLGRENDSSALNLLLLGLAKLPNLRLITISACPTSLVPLFSPMALEKFCHHVSDTLETLDLSGCGLQAFHLEVLLSTLATKTSLDTLHIQRNAAQDTTSLLQLVQENYFLQDVISDATGSTKEQLNFWLLLNQTIRPRLLSTNPSERFQVWCALIVDANYDPTILFYLLNEYQDYWIQ